MARLAYMLRPEAHDPWPEYDSDGSLANSEPVKASKHTRFADDADVDMAQAEPPPAEQLKQAQGVSAPTAPAPALVSPARTTPAAAAQTVAPEPVTNADMLAALLEFDRVHKPPSLTNYLLLDEFINNLPTEAGSDLTRYITFVGGTGVSEAEAKKVVSWAQRIKGSQRHTPILPVRSTAKAAQPELLYGTLKERGDKAGLWLSSYKAYMTASKELDPLAYLPSYLREALRWW